MARHLKRPADIGLAAVTIEGGLISPDQMAAVAGTTPDQKSAADYGCPKGTNLRDEITRYFRIGQAHWQSYAKLSAPNVIQTVAFVRLLLQEAFGFDALAGPNVHHADGHTYRIALEAKGGRVPIVVAAPRSEGDAFVKALPELGDAAGGTIPRRSPAVLLQDWLNAKPEFLWGLVFAGDRVRLMRDNASFTRPAYIEADLGAIFRDEMFADFTAIWLLIHASRFGGEDALPTDCPLERWREAGLRAGSAARERLGEGVEEALLALGQGFLDANPELRTKLDDHHLTEAAWFEQLLRVVYRLIFLAVSEDRDLLHERDATTSARALYGSAYGFGHMRERSARRSSHDHHHDAWEGAKIVFRALEHGEALLGLPPLGGLFAPGLTPDIEGAKLPNKAFLSAVFRLSWLIEDGRRVRINWRDMATEELGSVYEGLLELVPTREDNGRRFAFAGGDEARGNARKKSGSYYTPDGLVQALLDSTLDPILDRAEAQGGVGGILQLSIIDPACGSGHFLLGAARRMANRVALLRNSEAPDYSAAMRDVARHCIHGVDRNPMAIELAKVALWIETVEPGKPLGFLDANLRCGDSLLGVFDLAVLDQGIPDEAFKPLLGDQKDAANHYRAKNRREIKERHKIESGLSLSQHRKKLAQDFAKLHSRAEENLSDVEFKRELFASVMAADGAAHRLRTACDLWVAAWFAPKTAVPARGDEIVPTSGQIWEYLRGVSHDTLLDEAARCSRAHHFFHWPIEFPDVMSNGGFDLVIGNPPWERVEVQEQELFSASHPHIANAQNAAKRKRMIEELETSDPRAYASWREALKTATTEVAFYKDSGRFPLGSIGKVNTYAVFADLFRQSINETGRAGLIVPNGLVVGYTYRDFLKHLLNSESLVSFFGFENEDKIFRNVHNETKFGLLTIAGLACPVRRPWFTAHVRQPDQILESDKRYSLSLQDIESINPNTLNLPAFRWAKDAEITAKIHSAAPVLVRRYDDGREVSPWGVKFNSNFNMSTEAHVFIDHAEIASDVVSREATLATLRDGRRVFPLYEGKMFWHFDHRYGTYENQTGKQANKGVLPHVSDQRHDDPNYQIQPLYWVDAALTDEVLGDGAAESWFFSWRDVGPSERTFVGTIIPHVAVGNAAPIMLTQMPAAYRAALAGILSSLVVDYAARQKTHRMSFFVVEQLPVLVPSALDEKVGWLGTSIVEWLKCRVLELCYTNNELAGFALDLDFEHPPFRWNPERRLVLQAEIDAAMLHLYGLERDQAEWLINSFGVLRRYEEREFDEFRTRQQVLAIYDEMSTSKQKASAYRTRLTPGPADPSCCHTSGERLVHEQIGTLIDGIWGRPMQPQPGESGAVLAAILKMMDSPRAIREVRFAAALVLEPRLLIPLLSADEATEWRRLVGTEAEPLPGNVASFAASTNAGWGAAVRNHRGNGRLVEDLATGTWSAGVGLDQIETSGWPDGRASFVFEALKSIDLDAALNSLPREVQQWIGDAEAA